MTAESITPKKRSDSENPEKSFFHQAAIKGYETEIANLKKEIEQIQDNAKVRQKNQSPSISHHVYIF